MKSIHLFFQKLIKKDLFWFLVVVVIASFLRLNQLGSIPHGFHNDEIMNGYVGRFILETGQDLYGNPWPKIYFNNFGDYPNVVPMYLSGLFTLVFGVNEFGVRFPIAVAGIATVGLIFVICRWLFRDKWVAILTSLSLAILPWHLVLSRATAEGITATLVFITGFTLIFKSLEQKSWLKFVLGNLLLLSTYSLYPGFRVLAPIGSLIVIWLAFKTHFKLATIAATILLFSLTGYISQTTWGRGRYDQTSVFTHNNVIAGKALRYSTGLGEQQILTARIFHNKVVLVGQEILRQYTSYFSPTFWFTEGGKPKRYVISEHGQLLYSIASLMLLATIIQFYRPLTSMQLKKLFFKDRPRFFIGYLWLLLISPLATTLTLDDVPNIHRSAPVGVFLMFVVALSLAIILRFIKNVKIKKIAVLIFIGALSIEGLFFWHYYTRISKLTSMIYRNEEQRTLANWLLTHRNEYQKIWLVGVGIEPIHYLFHKQDFSPALAGKFALNMEISQIDNIYFLKEECFRYEKEKSLATSSASIALIVRAECTVPDYYREVDKINYIDQAQAYLVLEPNLSKSLPVEIQSLNEVGGVVNPTPSANLLN